MITCFHLLQVSIQLPYREMGSKAVEILIESIENSSTGRNIKVPNKIIERQSCKELSVV
jgi:DNA-binding LacI/PurR family transcriptional regulator